MAQVSVPLARRGPIAKRPAPLLTHIPHQHSRPVIEPTTEAEHSDRPHHSHPLEDERSSGPINLLRRSIGCASPHRMTLEPPRTPHGAVAAFFDVDNTLVHGTTLFFLAIALYRRGFFRMADLLRFTAHQARYATIGEHAGHLTELREHALDLLAGRQTAAVEQVAAEVYRTTLARRLYPGAVDLLTAHLAAGHQVWLVTATPVEIGRLLVTRLGATGCLATVAEQASGCYTGRLVGDPMHGPAKGRAVRELAARTGLDLTASYAYGDSVHDLSVLSAVGHPRVVNPDLQLKAIARRQQWPRYDFRTTRRTAARTMGALLPAAVLWWGRNAARRRTYTPTP